MTASHPKRVAPGPTTPQPNLLIPQAGMRVWFEGIPYTLKYRVIGVTWAADELFGSHSRYVLTTRCRECRLHGAP